MKFNDVIGQQELSNRLIDMVEKGKVPHAILLTGPSGSGKMAIAMAFASYLLGERADDATNNKAAEAMLRNWEHPDLHFSFPVIKPSGTSSDHKMICDDFIREWHELISKSPYFSMEEWLSTMNAVNQQAIIYAAESDELTRKLSLKASQGGYKVSIIWLPERMNVECANKLLKLLEEPPLQTIFILVSEEPELLLKTITSRTQRIEVKRIPTKEIEHALQQRRGIDAENARTIARVANGNWLKATDQLNPDNENSLMLQLFIELMRKAYMRDIREIKKWSETVAAFGRERQKRMLDFFIRMIRESFVYNFKNPELNYMTSEEEHFATNFARFINEANVIDIAEAMGKARRDISQNANAKIVMFDMALQIIVLLTRK